MTEATGMVKKHGWDAPSLGALPVVTKDENEWSQTQSVVPAGKGVAIPSSGECPEPFSEMALIGIGIRRGRQCACKAHQCLKAIVTENIVSTDNN